MNPERTGSTFWGASPIKRVTAISYRLPIPVVSDKAACAQTGCYHSLRDISVLNQEAGSLQPSLAIISNWSGNRQKSHPAGSEQSKEVAHCRDGFSVRFITVRQVS